MTARRALFALFIAACGSQGDQPRQTPGATPDTATRAATPAPFPRTGMAVLDTAGNWCAEFVIDSAAPALENGLRVTLVFAGKEAVASVNARVAGPHAGECPAAFAQPRWFGYTAVRLDLLGPPPAGADLPMVALVVASAAPWLRDADGVVRADLDGDGVREEARTCLADEGQHFTIWSPLPGGARARRWHEYYDWGAFTDANCKPGEKGERGSEGGG